MSNTFQFKLCLTSDLTGYFMPRTEEDRIIVFLLKN